MKIVLIFTFISLVLSNTSKALKPVKKLRVCTTKLPINLQKVNGQNLFEYMLSQNFSHEYSIFFLTRPYGRSIQSLKDNLCDIFTIAPSSNFGPEVLSVNSLLRDSYSIFSINNRSPHTPDKLKESTVIIVRDWNTPKGLTDKFKKTFVARDYQQAVKMLNKKRYQYLIGKETIINSYIKELNVSNISTHRTDYKSNYTFLLRRHVDSYKLKAQLEHYLHKHYSTGQYAIDLAKFNLPKRLLERLPEQR